MLGKGRSPVSVQTPPTSASGVLLSSASRKPCSTYQLYDGTSKQRGPPTPAEAAAAASFK